jgi:hypothetical protein
MPAVPEPQAKAFIISCRVNTNLRNGGERLYFVTKNFYVGRTRTDSAGSVQYFPIGSAPPVTHDWQDAKSIKRYAITEGSGYIDHFEDWAAVREFLYMMRAKDIQILEE